jgi:hypothetical protein
MDGEYLLLGRKVDDTANIFIQYGQGATRTFNTTQGSRVEGEWIDGFRMSVLTQQDALINADVKQPFTPALAAGLVALGMAIICFELTLVPWSYVINSTTTNSQVIANLTFPGAYHLNDLLIA